MARYSAKHVKNGVNTANTIMWQMRASSTNRLALIELGLAVKAAPTTGPSWRLVRAATVGTSTGTVAPQAEDPDVVAATGLLDITWSANPTLAAIDLREYATPNAIGSGIVWTWYDKPLVIPKSGGLLLVNGNATGTTVGSFAIYAVADE